MKIEKNGGKMAAWLDTFVSMYKKETVAETNAKNLPKVNWKDETFYVSFTPDGAVLYNDYGNEVSLIDNAKSVEEVNKYLNENSIVASVDGNDSTDCEDKDENKCSDNQEENDKDADRTVVGNEDVEDSGMDDGSEVTAEVDNSFENELKKVAEETPGCTTDEDVPNDKDQGFVPSEEDKSTSEKPSDSNDVNASLEKKADEFDPPQSETMEDTGTPGSSTDSDSGEITQGSIPARICHMENYVSKASYNKLVARLNALEKLVKADSDVVDEGIGDDGMGHAHSGDDSLPEGSGVGGDNGAGDDDTTAKIEMEKNVKADDASGTEESAGFQDIINGVGDAASAVGDAVSNAWDSACSYSQGDHIYNSVDNKHKRLVALTEQQYARTETPNDAYDLNSENEEVKHFEQSAQDTQKVIDKEHELDLSNINDRVKLNENFLQELFSIGNETPSDTEETVEETIEEPTSDTEEEPMVDEEVEAPVDIEEDVKTPDTETVEDVPVEETIEIEETPEFTDSPEDEAVIVVDNPEDLEEFMNQMCPCCEEEKSLQGVAQIGDYVGVKCAKCGQEYAVNNKTKEIFARK